MKVDKVTRDMIRDLKPMQLAEYELPTVQACESARMQVSHVKRTTGGTFKCHVNYDVKQIKVLRIS